jgi:predicted phage baseplate assembly protein
MSLPAPVLDDRRFQDIVDEAKRLIPRYCPEWTDHNVSDPGIALIELFAWMTELTLYRLNQLPDRLYVQFLELMGISLYPAASARTRLVFWLTGPRSEPVQIPVGTQVATTRTEQEEAVVFMTDEERAIRQPSLTTCLTGTADGRYEDQWDNLRLEGFSVRCFASLQVEDALYLGFDESLAGNVVRLDVDASIEGVGVDPQRPPWAWEAWSGDGWARCELLSDSTHGLNTGGAITLVLPSRHTPLSLGPGRAHWVRCRMTSVTGDQPPYQDSPQLQSLVATTLGGVASAHHAEPVGAEPLGRSDGRAGQTFTLRRTPVLPRNPGERVQVATLEEVTEWTEVADFVDSGPEDRHVVWDGSSGEIRFGPQVVYPDGTTVQRGAIPPMDARVTVTGYRHGGGARGNVGAGTLAVLKTSIPFIGRVENAEPAAGGVDAETVANAKLRGPLSLRSGQRAVTAEDYERLTLEAAPAVARARCLPPLEPGGPVRVLVVPRLHVDPRELALDDLALADELVEEVTRHLDERRMLTTTVEIRTPAYQGVTVVARIGGAAGSRPELVRDRALGALYAYINPLEGGPDGRGWPFGRTLNLGEVFALLSGLEGVESVDEVRLFLADLRGGERQEGRQRIALSAGALFASFQHQVLVR